MCHIALPQAKASLLSQNPLYYIHFTRKYLGQDQVFPELDLPSIIWRSVRNYDGSASVLALKLAKPWLFTQVIEVTLELVIFPTGYPHHQKL